jgi:6-phosphofructokinase
MRLGILTGGGDVPGLNASIKAFVNRAASEGHEVMGIRRGWGGLLDTDPDDLESVAANSLALGQGEGSRRAGVPGGRANRRRSA